MAGPAAGHPNASAIRGVLEHQQRQLREIAADISRAIAQSVAPVDIANLRSTAREVQRDLRAWDQMRAAIHNAGQNDLSVAAWARREEAMLAHLDDSLAFKALEAQARLVGRPIMQTAVVQIRLASERAQQLAVLNAEKIIGLQVATQNAAGVLPFIANAGRLVPVRAVSNIVGLMHTQSPFRGLAGLQQKGIDQIGRRLVEGVARGQHPYAVARVIVNDNIGVPMARALTIARTETMRAFRESASEWMQANTAVTGWVWECSGAACPACLAMSGETFSADVPMDSHPNCQCIQVPVTSAWDGSIDGGGATSADSLGIPSGEDVFAALPPAEQLKRLGPTKYELYRDGKIKLRDLVHVRHSAEWGDSVTVASVKQALANAS